MNTDQLRYLIEISKNVSMSAASEELHMTPQALNTAIKRLEEELGFSLLNRSFKGTSLTADGEWLVDEASHFLNKISERQEVHRIENITQAHTGNLNIFINYSGINSNILGKLICNLTKKEPDLIIDLQEISKSTVIEKVLNNEVSFGFIFQTTFNDTYTYELPSEIVFEPLFDGELVISTSQNSELAKQNTISLKKVSQFPLISYYVYPEPQTLIDHFFTETLNASIQFSHETSFSVYREKILQGVANSINVQFSLDPHPTNYVEGMKILHLRENIKVYFGFIYKKGENWNDNEKFFMEELKKSIANAKTNPIL